MFNQGVANIGAVNVVTLDYRGYTPEELAEMTVDKIIRIGQNSHPAIIEQARAFRENIRVVLVEAFRQAQEAERATIIGSLTKNGFEDIANLIRRI